MSIFEVGRLAVKIAGRDAGKTAIVIDVVDDNYVLIDGQARRKKCNVKHLEPLPQVVEIKKGASAEEVKAVFDKMGLEVKESKPKESKPRPKKEKVKKEKPVKQKTEPVKEAPKKQEKPAEGSFEEKVEAAQ